MVKNIKTHNLKGIQLKKDNFKNVIIKKNSLKNPNLKGGVFGFNNNEKFIDKYISQEEKGVISLYFSTSSILKKIKISKKINEKLIKLLKLYYKTESMKDSSNINIYINEISTENLRVFTQKTIDTRDFINTDFLNINLNDIFDFFDSNIGSEKCKNHFLNIYHEIVTRYVGDKYFKIHEKYNELLKNNKDFFEKVINFIKDRNSLYLFNINFIIIILYTYTSTRNLEKTDNIYFPKNYYEIIIKSFFEYIKKYGYPPMNKDFYSILRTLNKTEVDNLNKFDPSIKLSYIITHPSYTGKDIPIINKTRKRTPIQQTYSNVEDSPSNPARPAPKRTPIQQTDSNVEDSPSNPARPAPPQVTPSLSSHSNNSSPSRSTKSSRRKFDTGMSIPVFDTPSATNLSGLPQDFDGFGLHNSNENLGMGSPLNRSSSSINSSRRSRNTFGNSNENLGMGSPLNRSSSSINSSRRSRNTPSSSINSSRRSPSIKNDSPSDYKEYVAKLGVVVPPFTPQNRSPSLPSSQNVSPVAQPHQPESDSPVFIDQPPQPESNSPVFIDQPAQPESNSPVFIDQPPQRESDSSTDSLVIAPPHIGSVHNSSKSSLGLDDVSLVEQYSSISISSLFSSINDLHKSPSNYEGFVKLLKIINDNQEYGYRWRKLKYSNNNNYDLCDLNNNNTIISGCNDSVECQEYNKVSQKFRTYFVNYLNVSKNPYPSDQINPNNTGSNFYRTIVKNQLFNKISNLITTTKKQNIFKEVIISNSNSVLIADNKLKIYNLKFINQVLHVELSQDTTMKLQRLRLPEKTIFSTIYRASINNFKFAAKLSLCDNKTSKNKSYLEEIHLFDLVTKYAINKININLPIIYKTIQLNPNTLNVKKFGFVFEIFGQNTWFNYRDTVKNCDLGEDSTINCSISELYSGNCYMYIYDKDLKTDSSTYFNYLLNGFENIIISILSFWSVTKCLHRDTQMSNFLYKKLKKSTHDFNNYNIHGKKLYIKNLKCQWTLWDYASCLPFLYENYFQPINKNNLKSYDDIHMSVYLYCNNILNEHICQTYTKELYNIFHNDKNLEPIQLKTIYYINIFIINQILSGKNEYQNNTNLFFEKMLYFIHKLNIIVNVKPEYIKKIQNIEKQLNDHNYNFDIDFILKEFNRPKDTHIVKFVDINITKKTNQFNKFFLNESKICLICGKFIYNYLWYKNDYQKDITRNTKNDNYKKYNYTNNIVLMVMKVIKQLKTEKFQNKKITISKFINYYDLFATTINNLDTTSPNYYIGNEYIGNCWIRIKKIKDKNLKNIRGFLNEKNYNYLIQLFDINYKYIENKYIVKIPQLMEPLKYIDDIKSIYDLLNSDISYKHNYYILYNNKFFVPYNDINYKLYTSLN